MIFGHQRQLKIFSHFLKENSFPHAVLFSGPQKIGKRKIAIEISKFLFHQKMKEDFFEFSQKECNCTTCQQIEKGQFLEIYEVKEENQIPIKKIRGIREKISLSTPFSFKIVILDDVEKLSREAAGALLKILEEPRGNTIFFLLAFSPHLLPQTILSRCEIFRFHLLKREEIKEFIFSFKNKIEKLDEILDFSFGRPGMAKEFIIDKNKIFYYNSFLEKIQKVKDLNPFERLREAEKLEKEGKLEDFFLMARYWFYDLLLVKREILPLIFKSKFQGLRKISEEFSREKIEKIVKEAQRIQKYFLFSNVSKILAIENFLLEI